mgnify:CR=1 FL=1
MMYSRSEKDTLDFLGRLRDPLRHAIKAPLTRKRRSKALLLLRGRHCHRGRLTPIQRPRDVSEAGDNLDLLRLEQGEALFFLTQRFERRPQRAQDGRLFQGEGGGGGGG